MLYIIYTYITTNITIWLYTERARAVSEPKFPKKSATILGLLRRHLQSVRIQTEAALPEPLARRSQIHYFFGNFRILRFPQKCRFWGKFPLPSQCTTGQMQHGRSRTVGGSIPPRSVPTPCELLPLLLRYCICALSNTHLCETARLLHPPSTAHTMLASSACARCFGELLWDAAFGSNFGEQLWGTTVGSNFAALQQH